MQYRSRTVTPGANFTFGTEPAGFTNNDNITASFTVNKPLAADMNFALTSIGATNAIISNGVYTLPLTGDESICKH